MCLSTLVGILEHVTQTMFTVVESLYRNPRYMIILSLSIILSMNVYFSIVQMYAGGFIEGDMWFYAYRIEEIAENGIRNLFFTSRGGIDIHPPVYYLFTVPLRKIGLSVIQIAFVLRIVVPVIIIYIIYKMTSLLFNTTTAGIACLFVALMPPSGFYHGLWTSTSPTLSLVPFLAGMYAMIKFSEYYNKKWLLYSILFFIVASFTHLLTAFASLIFLVCSFYFFRDKIPKITVMLLGSIFLVLCVYGFKIYSGGGSRSIWDMITYAASPRPEIASNVRQLFFIAYWPRYFTFLTSACFLITIYYFYHNPGRLRKIDKTFLVWITVVTVYTQLFLVGVYLSNQRFILYLLFGIAVYGAYGFTKLMPVIVKKNDVFLKFLVIASILLFSGYQMGIAVLHYPQLIDASEIESLKIMKEYLPDDAVVYIEEWKRIPRHRFAYLTGHDHIIWDVSVNTTIATCEDSLALLSVLENEHIEYMVVAAESKNRYTHILGEHISVIWFDDQFYLLKVCI